jgi:hypothetical protein
LNAEEGKECISELTIENGNLHEISHDNGFIVNFFNPKISLSKVKFAQIATFINILERSQMGNTTIRFIIF